LVGVALVAAAAAFVLLRARSGFAWAEFQRVLTQVDGIWLALAIPAILATYGTRALRWSVMLRPLRPDADLWRLTGATCIGFTAVVLFGRAGEAVRPYLIARQNRVPFSTQVAAWVVERILDLLMILVIFGVALTQVENSGLEPGPKVRLAMEAGGWMAGLTGAACLAVLVALRLFRGRVRQRLMEAVAFLPERMRARIEQFLTAFDQGMQSTRERSAAGILLGYSVVEWVVVALAFWCVFRAFPGLDGFRLADVIIVLGFVSFGSAVQLPGIGGGMQISTVLVLTELYGAGVELASGVALVLWAVNFLVVVPLGLAWAFHEGVKWRNMSRVSDVSETQGPAGAGETRA
jgi:uncharacterized protein (TIRG00374 family)